MSITEETLAKLVRAGRKVSCPICGKRAMSQKYNSFSASGIGSHILHKHPQLMRDIRAASKKWEKKLKLDEQEREKAKKKEEKARPIRKFVVTGEFLDEVCDELNKLIGYMEPYYAQANCENSSYELIARIEKMHEDARILEKQSLKEEGAAP